MISHVSIRALRPFPTIIVLAAMIVGAFGISLLPLPVIVVALGVSVVAIGTLIEPGIGLIVMLLVGPWAAWMNTYYPGLLPIDLGQIMVGVTLAAWVLRGLAHRDLVFPKSPLLLPLVIFVGWAAVTMLWAPDLSFGLPEVVKWIEVVLIMLFTIDLARRRGVKWIVAAVLITMVAQAAIGIYEARLRGVGPDGFRLTEGVYRAYGTFEQPNPFGGFIGLGLPIAVALTLYFGLSILNFGLQSLRSRRQAVSFSPRTVVIFIGYGAVAGLLALALYLSLSRGAWLGAAAAIGAMIALAPRRLWIGLGLAGVAVVALIALSSAGLLPTTISERLADATDLLDIRDVRGVPINDANYALIERQAHWQAAVNMLTEHPWTGVGFSNYQPVYDQYRLLNWPMPLGHAHNIYLNVAAETGLPGLAAYLVLWGTIFILTFRTLRRTLGFERALTIGLMGVWVHLCVHMLVDNLYVNNTHLMIGALFGLLVVLHESRHTAQPHRETSYSLLITR